MVYSFESIPVAAFKHLSEWLPEEDKSYMNDKLSWLPLVAAVLTASCAESFLQDTKLFKHLSSFWSNSDFIIRRVLSLKKKIELLCISVFHENRLLAYFQLSWCFVESCFQLKYGPHPVALYSQRHMLHLWETTSFTQSQWIHSAFIMSCTFTQLSLQF